MSSRFLLLTPLRRPRPSPDGVQIDCRFSIDQVALLVQEAPYQVTTNVKNENHEKYHISYLCILAIVTLSQTQYSVFEILILLPIVANFRCIDITLLIRTSTSSVCASTSTNYCQYNIYQSSDRKFKDEGGIRKEGDDSRGCVKSDPSPYFMIISRSYFKKFKTF